MSVDLRELERRDVGRDGEIAYTAVSVVAVIGLGLGILSIAALDSVQWQGVLVVPVPGIVVSLWAMSRIKASGGDLTGGRLARTGFILSTTFFLIGSGLLAYSYATEVPEDHRRISYAELQPTVEVAEGVNIPDSAWDLDGKQVFIKGYIYPNGLRYNTGIKQFLLVRDKGTCCFGGPVPKLTDMIEVVLDEPLTVDYSPRIFRLAGRFKVEPTEGQQDVGQVLYHLDAGYVK